jgi:hypothetical protein
MSLAILVLALFLVLFGINLLGWVLVSSLLLGILAFVAGILFFLEGLGAFSYSVNTRNK